MSEKKTDPSPAAASATSAAAASTPTAAGGGGGMIKNLLPVILACVLAPAATFALAQFVLLPRFEAGLQAALAAPLHPTPEGALAARSAAASAKGAARIPEGNAYRFENVVVNLAGTMGTRYLKTSFLVTGPKPDVVTLFDNARPQLGDITISILSSVTLADLEEPGAKNIIRERLLAGYNQALGSRVVDNLYFSEFVVQ